MKVVGLLIRHEGIRLKPYRDTVGKLTIGVGRNLDDKGISEVEAKLLLANDIEEAERDLKTLPWFESLDEVRQAVLIDMCVNMGFKRLLTFQRTLDALAQGNFNWAAQEMLQSKWAQQVPQRARELSDMVRSGAWPADAAE